MNETHSPQALLDPAQPDVVALAAPMARHLLTAGDTAVQVPTDEAEIRQRIGHELQDDPTLTLDQLDSDEQSRIHIRYLAIEHEDGKFEGIARSMGEVGYFIFEGPLYPTLLQNYGGRLGVDRRINLHARGLDLPTPESGRTHLGANGFVGPYVAVAAERGWELPIFRSMDVEMDDVPPDPRFKTYEDQRLGIEAASRRVGAELYTEPSEQLRESLMEIAGLEASFDAAREQKQIDDVSVIIANAARRHPGTDIFVGIATGSQHADILATLTEGTAVDAQRHMSPAAAAKRWSALNGLALQSVEDGGYVFSDEELDRTAIEWMLEGYIRAILDDRYDITISLPRVSQFVQTQVSQVDLKQYTHDIDGIKQECAQDYPSSPDDQYAASYKRIYEYLYTQPGIPQLIDDICELVPVK